MDSKGDSRERSSQRREGEHRASALQWIAGVAMLREYEPGWLVHDLFAGLTLSAVLIPAGMAYAEAAGLPAVNGLYASYAAMLAYALFGPSRVLVLGPDSALVALIAASVAPLAHGDGAHALAAAGALAVMAGVACIVVGALRLGFVTELLSLPVRYGFLNGIIVTIVVGQLPKLLGFSSKGESFFAQVRELIAGVSASRVNLLSLAIGVGSLLLIFACKYFWPKAPSVLLAVGAATLALMWMDPAGHAGVATVGVVAQGLPAPRLPALPLGEWLQLAGSAAAIALVSFTDVSILSRTYELRTGRKVSRNQECVALGLSNIAAGLLQGFAVSASGSRTPVAESAGARTQVTGVIAAVVVALLLVFAPRALAHTPQSALAAVVIAACVTMIEIRGVIRLFRLRLSEFAQAMVCFVGVVCVGVVNGIALALLLTVLSFLWRAWRPYDAVLGRVDGMKGYHDVSRHPEARRIPGLVLLRWDAPLFFANSEIFREHVLRAIDASPSPVTRVVIAAEPVTDIDLTAADVLQRIHEELDARHVELCFAELKGPVKDSLKRYGMFDLFGEAAFYPTVGEAVRAYLDEHDVEWHDWEDDVTT